MNHRNLIPVRRLDAKRTARAIRRWLWIDTGYVFVLVITGAIYVCSGLHPLPQQTSSPVAAETEKANTALATLRQESVGLRTNLQRMLQVSKRPDWSILLAAISRALGDDVVLNAVDCTEETTNAAATVARVDSIPERFRIAGIGRSQQSVMQLILRLEQLRFFSRVQLVQTSPQSLHGYEGVGFQLVCDLQESHGSKQ